MANNHEEKTEEKKIIKMPSRNLGSNHQSEKKFRSVLESSNRYSLARIPSRFLSKGETAKSISPDLVEDSRRYTDTVLRPLKPSALNYQDLLKAPPI